jgi:hypothetical protein
VVVIVVGFILMLVGGLARQVGMRWQNVPEVERPEAFAGPGADLFAIVGTLLGVVGIIVFIIGVIIR